MNMTIGAASLAIGILLFWATLIGTRLAQPPRWTGDTMVMCFLAPLIIFLCVAGAGILGYLVLTGALRRMGPVDYVGVGAVLATAAVLGALLAHWSRRTPRANSAEVIPLEQPEAPEPPRPIPQHSSRRKAA